MAVSDLTGYTWVANNSPTAGFSNLVNCQEHGNTFDYILYNFTGNASATMTFDED